MIRVLRAHSRQIDVCLMRVSCVLYYYSSTNTVFELLPSLLPAMTCVKPNPDAVFRWGFHPKMAPLFLLEADPKTIPENGSLKNRHFRVYKIAKQDLGSENVYFLVRIRLFQRDGLIVWPIFRYPLVISL